MFCSRCGKPLPGGASYCPGCGAAVPAVTAWASSAGPAVAEPSVPPAAPAPPATAPAGEVRYGGFWRRLVAFIVDGLILGAIMTPFGLGLGLAHLGAAMAGDMTSEAFAALMMTSILLWFVRVILSWVYGAGFESSSWQATPGKRLLGLRVTDLEGRRITFLRGTARSFGKVLSGLILGMGYVLAAFTDRKQALHDLIAGTLVRR